MRANTHWTLRVRIAACLVTILVAAQSAGRLWAHGGGGDIAIYTNKNDLQVHVGFAVLDENDEEQIDFDPSDKVFQAVLIPRTPSTLPPIPYAIGTTEPGFDADELELPPLAAISLDTHNLWYWDGEGAVDFAPPVGISGGYAPRNDIADAEGGFHAHPTFGVCDDSAANCADVPVPNGVYLAELSVSVDGLEDSEPYYLVALVDDSLYTGDAEMDAENGESVGEMVRDYLADPTGASAPEFNGKSYVFYADAVTYAESLVVPEPSTVALVILAATGVLGCRRRLTLAR